MEGHPGRADANFARWSRSVRWRNYANCRAAQSKEFQKTPFSERIKNKRLVVYIKAWRKKREKKGLFPEKMAIYSAYAQAL